MAMEIKIFLRNLLAFQVEPLNMAPVCQKVAADISGHLAFGQSLHTQTEATNQRLVDAMASVNGIINLFSKFSALRNLSLSIVFSGENLTGRLCSVLAEHLNYRTRAPHSQ